MRSRDMSSWIWRDALAMLEQVERLQRQFFRAGFPTAQCWKPPIDVLESEDEVIVQAASLAARKLLQQPKMGRARDELAAALRTCAFCGWLHGPRDVNGGMSARRVVPVVEIT